MFTTCSQSAAVLAMGGALHDEILVCPGGNIVVVSIILRLPAAAGYMAMGGEPETGEVCKLKRNFSKVPQKEVFESSFARFKKRSKED